MLSKLRYALKIIRLITHIAVGLGVCFFLFPWLKKDAQKNHIQRWSKKLLIIFNVRVTFNLAHATPGSILISNHISWLDIFVINSLAPCRFVAKADIRSWPILGWLAERGGTIYISRGSKADVRRIYQYLIEQIEAGERVAFFPEGTTSSQGTVLPFHANLFEAAIHAKVAVQPLALRYLDSAGELDRAVEFIDDMSAATSLVNVLRRDEITVELHGLTHIASEGAHRRDLAAASRQAVAMALQIDGNV